MANIFDTFGIRQFAVPIEGIEDLIQNTLGLGECNDRDGSRTSVAHPNVLFFGSFVLTFFDELFFHEILIGYIMS